MEEIIGFFTLLGSFAGIIAILYRKIPRLRELPRQEDSGGLQVPSLVEGLRRLFVGLKVMDPEKILHKTLSKIRVLAMKTENQTAEWLRELRQSSRERRTKFSESYLDQFKKKTTKEKQN